MQTGTSRAKLNVLRCAPSSLTTQNSFTDWCRYAVSNSRFMQPLLQLLSANRLFSAMQYVIFSCIQGCCNMKTTVGIMFSVGLVLAETYRKPAVPHKAWWFLFN